MSHLLTTLAVPDGTGAMAMMSAYTSALVAAGHTLTLAHGPVPDAHHGPGSRAQGILDGLDDLGVDRIVICGLQSTYSLTTAGKLAAVARERSAEAIIAYQQVERKYALVAASRSNIPCIISGGNRHQFFGPMPVRWVKQRGYGRILRSVSMFVATSETVRDEATDLFGLEKQRTTILPNGIRTPDSADSSRVAVRAQLGVGEDEVLAVCVGRIDVQKGQDLLIESLEHIDDETRSTLRIVLVGDRPASRNRERMAAYHNRLLDSVQHSPAKDVVLFAGWCDDVRGILEAADFYVQPSRWEGPSLPVAALEAMAAGKAVVLTDCSGQPAGFINGTHGYVVSNGSNEDMGRAVQRMTAMTGDERARMGSAAQRLRQSRYDITTTGRRFVEVVEQTIGQYRGSQRVRPA